MKSFLSIFYRHLATFYWSHCSTSPENILTKFVAQEESLEIRQQTSASQSWHFFRVFTLFDTVLHFFWLKKIFAVTWFYKPRKSSDEKMPLKRSLMQPCGQSFLSPTIIVYVSRVVSICNLLVSKLRLMVKSKFTLVESLNDWPEKYKNKGMWAFNIIRLVSAF